MVHELITSRSTLSGYGQSFARCILDGQGLELLFNPTDYLLGWPAQALPMNVTENLHTVFMILLGPRSSGGVVLGRPAYIITRDG
jgi:hypothetical protein